MFSICSKSRLSEQIFCSDIGNLWLHLYISMYIFQSNVYVQGYLFIYFLISIPSCLLLRRLACSLLFVHLTIIKLNLQPIYILLLRLHWAACSCIFLFLKIPVWAKKQLICIFFMHVVCLLVLCQVLCLNWTQHDLSWMLAVSCVDPHSIWVSVTTDPTSYGSPLRTQYGSVWYSKNADY